MMVMMVMMVMVVLLLVMMQEALWSDWIDESSGGLESM